MFGAQFTIPFGYASLIWPATGVVLGLYLLYGRSILIGALLSSLLIFHQQSLLTPLPVYTLIILACTTVLQFIISKQLISHFIALPVKIYNPSQILKFLLLSGPIPTFFSATIFTITLSLSLSLNIEVLIYIWAAKWIGDFISIVFITPSMLFIVKNDYAPKTKRPYAVMVTSLLVLSVIFFIFNLNSFNKHQAKKQQFINSTTSFIEQVNVAQSTIKHHLSALDGLFQANNTISREMFRKFTQRIEQSKLKIKAIAWLPLIAKQERELFEQKLIKDNLGKYIKHLTNNGFQASTIKDYYLPILFSEPLEANKSAIGLDVSTHPFVKETVHEAIHNNTYVVTPLLSLVQQQNKYTGIIVYYPVYKENALSELRVVNTTPDLTKLHGLVEVVFELDFLLEDIYQKIKLDNYTYRLNYGENNIVAHPQHKNGMFHHDVDINIFDKKGHISFSSTEKFELTMIDWSGISLILIACSIGIICVMFVFLIVSFNYSLSKKIKERTIELTRTNEELTSANKAKNLFLANISHEYRTPLNAIIGFAEIAQREVNDKIAVDYFNKINHSSSILLGIVNDVLDISKMQAGELNLENRSFNPSIETYSVIEILNEKAKEKSLKISLNLSQNFNCWVAGDALRFKQILINLINNSIKFTNEGEIIITGECNYIHNNAVLTLSIKDSGIGIAKEQQKHIFSSFAQAENSTTRKYGGTGLGLSIVKQLCTLMHGDVSLTSQVGKGCEFTVKLTLEQASEPAKTSTVTQVVLQQTNFDKFNILVVEDNKINQVIVQKQLLSLGAKSDVADDGMQALNYLERQSPDLIFMDLQMPNMDGFTASTLIKKNETLKHIPIVILSASVGKEDKEKAKTLGIEDFINKPFQQADILFVLNKYLSHK